MLFYDAWNFLVQSGFIDVIIPIILVYAITYAILDKTKLLGDLKSDPQAAGRAGVISLAVAFLFTAATYAVNALKIYTPTILLFAVLAFFMLITVGVILANTEGYSGQLVLSKRLAYIISAVLVIAILGYIAAVTGILNWIVSMVSGVTAPTISVAGVDLGSLFSILVTLGIILGVTYWISKPK